MWHMVVFKQAYLDFGIWTKFDDPRPEFGMLAMLVQGGLFSTVHQQMRTPGAGAVRNGLRLGISIALVVSSSQVFATAAHITCTDVAGFVMLEGLYAAIQFPLCGIAIAAAMGDGDLKAPRQPGLPLASMAKGAVAFLVVTVGSQGVWHMALFKQQYIDLNIWDRFPDHLIVPFGMLSMLLQAVVCASWFRAGGTVADGAVAGFQVGVGVASVAVFASLAKISTSDPLTYALLEGGCLLLLFPLSGAALAAAAGSSEKEHTQ